MLAQLSSLSSGYFGYKQQWLHHSMGSACNFIGPFASLAGQVRLIERLQEWGCSRSWEQDYFLGKKQASVKQKPLLILCATNTLSIFSSLGNSSCNTHAWMSKGRIKCQTQGLCSPSLLTLFHKPSWFWEPVDWDRLSMFEVTTQFTCLSQYCLIYRIWATGSLGFLCHRDLYFQK